LEGDFVGLWLVGWSVHGVGPSKDNAKRAAGEQGSEAMRQVFKTRSFTVPKRPAAMRFTPLGVICAGAMLVLFAYVAGFWVLVLLAYVVGVEARFLARELFWSLYATQCDAAFSAVNEAYHKLGVWLKSIADALNEPVEADDESARKDPGSVTLMLEPSPTGEVKFWAAKSKGTN
jgi:hypothetical protein